MSRKITVIAGALIMGTAAAAFSVSAYGAGITEEDAKEIAFEDAGLREDDMVSVRTASENEDGRKILEVSFVTEDYEEYEYEILAESGLIYGTSYDAAASAADDAQETSLDRAKEIAAKHAGEAADQVVFTKSGTEKDDGRTVHELEFRTEDEKVFDYEIDADTGMILSWDYDGENHLAWLEKNQQGSGSSSLPAENDPVSGLEAAKDAALAKAGLRADEVTWGRVHEDFDDGRLVYEGSFFHGSDEYEFEADAATGEIISWETDSIFD